MSQIRLKSHDQNTILSIKCAFNSEIYDQSNLKQPLNWLMISCVNENTHQLLFDSAFERKQEHGCIQFLKLSRDFHCEISL